MKKKKSIQQSMEASFADIEACASTISHTLIRLYQDIKHDDSLIPKNGLDGRTISHLREKVESLNKAFHEFNAYHNILFTE